jgi:hypothetical protein
VRVADIHCRHLIEDGKVSGRASPLHVASDISLGVGEEACGAALSTAPTRHIEDSEGARDTGGAESRFVRASDGGGAMMINRRQPIGTM